MDEIKVKVLQCSRPNKYCWYANKIDQTFIVQKDIYKKEDGNWFAVVGEIKSDKNLYYGGILEGDCVIVQDDSDNPKENSNGR